MKVIFNRQFFLITQGCLFLIFLMGASGLVHASQTVFEGYYTVELGGKPVGYSIQRYTFDKKKKGKEFEAVTFLYLNELAGKMSQALKAYSNEKFQPHSYSYTETVGKKMKIIDAKFKSEIADIQISTDGKKAKILKKQMPKGTFLSSFLGYMMLKNGFAVGKKFKYSAVAEEDSDSYDGEAFIKSTENLKDHTVYRVLNRFKGAKFISYVTPKGVILGTEAPLAKLTTRLVKNQKEATKKFPVPTKSLKTLFGKLPIKSMGLSEAKSTSKALDSKKSGK